MNSFISIASVLAVSAYAQGHVENSEDIEKLQIQYQGLEKMVNEVDQDVLDVQQYLGGAALSGPTTLQQDIDKATSDATEGMRHKVKDDALAQMTRAMFKQFGDLEELASDLYE